MGFKGDRKSNDNGFSDEVGEEVASLKVEELAVPYKNNIISEI
jgi:hypothetical protein